MKTRKLILLTAALAASGAALAQSSPPKTRAEVNAEAVAAREAGDVRVGDTVVLRDLLSVPSQRMRAEVHAEAVAANKARLGTITYGDAPLRARLLPGTSTFTRTQVRAEAIEARRLGLVSAGEAEARLPTPAEAESVRQAGLRAIGKENVAKR